MRFILLLGIAGTAFALAQRTPRIVGGSPTTIEQYPYMSNVQYLLRGFYWMQWCGGSLITTRAVLSAAQCYYDDRTLSSWRVRLGTNFASSGGTVHQVMELLLHDGYDHNNFQNDVAILRLATPATLSATVARARIPGPNFTVPDTTRVIALGWGALTYGGGMPERLHHVDINVINHQVCIDRYAYLRHQEPGFEDWPVVTSGMVCAGVLDFGGKDSCSGDTGGPVVINRDIIFGISSWGFECANEFYPGVNTRVAFYSSWIVANANVNEPI